MSNVNLNLYKIFCKVVESKSLSDASEKLDVSVPNISTQISNLENQLGLKLFNREPKGLKITEDGKELYEIVSKSISSFDFAEKMAQDKNNIETGNITIGCPSHFTTYFLMDKIEKVKRQYPKINIKVVCEADTNKMLELLQEHKIDFAIIDSDLDRINVVVEEILKIENIFVSKAPLIIQDIKEIQDLNCILNLENTKTTQCLKETLREYNVDIKSNMMSDATEVRVDAVKRNMGIAYVIKKSVKRELEAKELYEVELPIKLPSVKLNLIYLKGELSKVSKSFIKNYLKYFLTNNFIKFFLEHLEIDGETQLSRINKKQKNKLIEALKNFKFEISGFNKDLSHVTLGGINIENINPKTMESTITDDLYFAGEVLEPVGPTGGYNLKIAFSTGYLAGLSASKE